MTGVAALPAAFRRGYVAGTSAPALRDLPNWRHRQVSWLHFALHPETQWASASKGGSHAVVIGEAVDIGAETIAQSKIARRLVTALSTSFDEAVRYAAYLGGRATYYLFRGDEVLVVPDYASAHSIFWHASGSSVTLSNYSHLLGEVTGAPLNEPYIDLMRRARDLGATRTIYWPGIETPFIGIDPVLPHHLLAFRRGGSGAQHRRFYPFADTELPRDVETAYNLFRERFVRHTQLLVATERTVGVSLTGGRDSRASLQAALTRVAPSQIRTWTYLSDKPPESMLEDARAARDVARHVNVQHDIVFLKSDIRTAASEAFLQAQKRTFRYSSQFPAVPQAYAANLPADLLELQSMVAECGTGFFKRRQTSFSVDRVVQLYQDSPFGSQPLVRRAIERYLDYSGVAVDDIAPLEWYDVVYQEARIGRWGALRIQEVELAHRIHLPFNARGIIEALSGPDLADRVDKQALVRLVKELH